MAINNCNIGMDSLFNHHVFQGRQKATVMIDRGFFCQCVQKGKSVTPP